jgi:hypothetical protein
VGSIAGAGSAVAAGGEGSVALPSVVGVARDAASGVDPQATSNTNGIKRIKVRDLIFKLLSRLVEWICSLCILHFTRRFVNRQVTFVTNDPDDNRVLECALVGGASYIVSGNTHLLELGEYRQIVILNPVGFLAALKLEG